MQSFPSLFFQGIPGEEGDEGVKGIIGDKGEEASIYVHTPRHAYVYILCVLSTKIVYMCMYVYNNVRSM